MWILSFSPFSSPNKSKSSIKKFTNGSCVFTWALHELDVKILHCVTKRSNDNKRSDSRSYKISPFIGILTRELFNGKNNELMEWSDGQKSREHRYERLAGNNKISSAWIELLFWKLFDVHFLPSSNKFLSLFEVRLIVIWFQFLPIASWLQHAVIKQLLANGYLSSCVFRSTLRFSLGATVKINQTS